MKFFNAIHTSKNSFLTHLTDIEGNLQYLANWAARSNIVGIQNGSFYFKRKAAEDTFVFGGDFCHKGPGDITIGRLLNEFKDKYPKQVILIAGKHEIKSRRFTDELDPKSIRQRLIDGPAPFWNPDATPRKYLLNSMKKQHIQVNSLKDLEYYLKDQNTEDCQTLYLKWMLEETMGCGSHHNKPSTFEYRRQELTLLKMKAVQKVSDQEVTQSFIDSVAPGGMITRYLKNAKLGAIKDDTLFIHGAVTLDNMGFVPGMPEDVNRISCAKEWIDSLNSWYRDQINHWINHPTENEFHVPGQSELDHYVLYNPRSVVTSNWYTRGKLAPIHPKIEAFLNKAGIHRVVCGQQAFGDFPLIIRNPNLEVIVGDTSYSDVQAKQNTRGDAIHNLEIKQHKSYSCSIIDAVRKGGSPTCIELPSSKTTLSGSEQTIGQFTKDGKLIRPGTDAGLVACVLDGFDVIDEKLESHNAHLGMSK